MFPSQAIFLSTVRNFGGPKLHVIYISKYETFCVIIFK